MKKTIRGTFTKASLLCLFIGTATTSSAAIVGDINQDGQIDTTEAVYALQVSSGLYPTIPDSCQLTGLGTWEYDIEYNMCDVVEYNGATYASQNTHSSEKANRPPNEDFWTPLSIQGEQGPTGPRGLTGLRCWDSNENSICNLDTEDVNYDGVCDVNDCKPAHKGSIYRWQVFSTYPNGLTWVMGNQPDLHGGVRPNSWTDGSKIASDMSSDPEILRSLLTRKGYGGANAMVYSEVFHQYSSTNGKVIVVLFRIKNTTDSSINWTPSFYYTCDSSWGEKASLSLNGTNTWNSGATNCGASNSLDLTISIPAASTSTVTFTSTSSTGDQIQDTSIHIRYTNLTFFDNSLTLPAGLIYVDDLDRVEGPLW